MKKEKKTEDPKVEKTEKIKKKKSQSIGKILMGQEALDYLRSIIFKKEEVRK